MEKKRFWFHLVVCPKKLSFEILPKVRRFVKLDGMNYTLVMDTHIHNQRITQNSNSNSSLEENNYDSTSSSVIDLLLSMTRRRSVSSSDIYDGADDEIDHFDKEEVSHFLKSTTYHFVFPLSFVMNYLHTWKNLHTNIKDLPPC